METITSPRPGSPDRFIECQEAIEGQMQELIAEAVQVGWSKAETLAAIIEVAENLALGMGEDEEMAAILSAIKKMTD